jgi:hypothetical protein
MDFIYVLYFTNKILLDNFKKFNPFIASKCYLVISHVTLSLKTTQSSIRVGK